MSVETNSHNYTNMNLTFSQFKPARISPKQKEEQAEDSSPDPSSARASPSPRLLCPRKIVAGGVLSGFAFLVCVSDLAKKILKVLGGFNWGAKKLDTNSNLEVERVRPAFAKATVDRSPSPANGGAGL